MKRKRVIAICLAVTFALTGVVFGASSLKSINVDPNTAKIYVNNNILTADNFNYNGTLYVPLRAVSENMGGSVSWDQATKTAAISLASGNGSSSAIDQAVLAQLHDYNEIRNVMDGLIALNDWIMTFYDTDDLDFAVDDRIANYRNTIAETSSQMLTKNDVQLNSQMKQLTSFLDQIENNWEAYKYGASSNTCYTNAGNLGVNMVESNVQCALKIRECINALVL